jgi:membrane protein YdbS with pleckstrin-like domain
MLTNDEKLFMEYWEKNRDKEKKVFRQLIYGSPWGLIFALPILLVVIFDEWYKNMIPISKSQIILITITVIGIAVFYALFRMRFKWENNEQLYEELKFKEKKSDTPLL